FLKNCTQIALYMDSSEGETLRKRHTVGYPHRENTDIYLVEFYFLSASTEKLNYFEENRYLQARLRFP
ncbi:MAG: hypothetical protein AAFY78_24470, partial [Cyanobacteria bacterium J06648_16]